MTSAGNLNGLTADDLRKYRPSSVADAVLLLNRAELQDLSQAGPGRHPLARLAGALAGDPDADIGQLSQAAIARSPREREAIENGRDLAGRFLRAPGPARAVKRLMEDVTDYAWPGEAGALHVTETSLRALQLFGYAARIPAGAVRTAADYAHAAALVLASGDRYGAAILMGFAYRVMEPVTEQQYLTDGNVRAHHERWAERHQDWQFLAPAGPLPTAPVGRQRRGTDGAAYTLALVTRAPGGLRPAVTVRASVGAEETVTFPSRNAAAEWLANRALTAHGPLSTTADGPACRTVREDEILARLLRDPDDTGLRALVTPDTFTSDLRAELYHVIAHYSPDRVRPRFADAMLRAPGWALRDIGWPHPHRALRYLDRLQATPVTAAQARDAAHAVAAAQEQADSRRPGIVITAPPPPRPVPPQARRTIEPRRPLLAPPPNMPSPAGPIPRPLFLLMDHRACPSTGVRRSGTRSNGRRAGVHNSDPMAI